MSTTPASTRNSVLDIVVPPGLKGVPVADTSIGDVLGSEGYFHYRGHDATIIAREHSFEAAWHLLWEGRLPSPTELRTLHDDAGAARVAAFNRIAPLAERIVSASPGADTLDLLRVMLAVLTAQLNLSSWIDLDRAAIKQQTLQCVAAMPVIVALVHRLRSSQSPVAPDPAAGHVVDYLRMCSGTAPQPARARALEQYLVMTMDHGFNASTFTARVVTSTGTDIGGAFVAALAALAGPLHGGAPSRALAMVDAIATRDNAEPWLRARIESGERLMGFGHPVYVTEDPRSRLLEQIAQSLGGEQVALARHIQHTAVRLLEEYKPGRGLRTNVEFYAALVMREVGLPDELFTPTFAVSRAIGWGAHILEQTIDNRIYRPSARYVGAVETE